MRRAALLLTVVLLALTGGLSGASAGPPPTKAYAATASLVEGGTAVRVVLSNCAPCGTTTSTQPFGSAEVRLPLRAGLDAAGATLGTAGWRLSLRTEAGSAVLRLTSAGRGTTTAVAPGQALVLRLPVVGGGTGGRVELATAVKQSNDFSGSGNDFARVGPDATVSLPDTAPVDLAWVQGPSTVQVSPAGTPTPGLTPLLVMCPAPQVRVVDGSGATVTTLPPTRVTLTAGGGAPDLRLAGSPELTALTVSGVATFGAAPSADGTCSSGLTAEALGTGLTLSATAVLSGTAKTVQAPGTFDVLGSYALCAETCTSPVLRDGPDGDTTAQVRATGGSGPADRLTFSVGQDPWDTDLTAACDPDRSAVGPNPYRSAVTVDLADHDKLVELRWSKRAVQWATNNGAPQWQVCMAAVYAFPTTTGEATPVGTWFVGALLPCAQVDPTRPCLARLGRSGGEQVATVRIPDVEGDPRMI